MNPAYWLTAALAVLATVDRGAESLTLTTAGWAVMITSIGLVVTLVSYCLYRVLSLPPVEIEDIKGPLEIDTGDTKNAD